MTTFLAGTWYLPILSAILSQWRVPYFTNNGFTHTPLHTKPPVRVSSGRRLRRRQDAPRHPQWSNRRAIIPVRSRNRTVEKKLGKIIPTGWFFVSLGGIPQKGAGVGCLAPGRCHAKRLSTLYPHPFGLFLDYRRK